MIELSENLIALLNPRWAPADFKVLGFGLGDSVAAMPLDWIERGEAPIRAKRS